MIPHPNHNIVGYYSTLIDLHSWKLIGPTPATDELRGFAVEVWRTSPEFDTNTFSLNPNYNPYLNLTFSAGSSKILITDWNSKSCTYCSAIPLEDSDRGDG